MNTHQPSRLRSTWVRLLHSSLILVGMASILFGTVACEDPVSDDAEVTVTGTVTNPDGSPAANQDVELLKSDLPTFSNDFLLGTAIATFDPFRTVTTDADGDFTITMKGEDANASGGSFAAYFAVVVERGETGGLAVASNEFQFSNQDLDQPVGELAFWDDTTVDASGGDVDISWSASRTAPRDDTYVATIEHRWMQQVDGGTSTTIDARVLDNDSTEANAQLLSLGNEYRYRTSLAPFTYDASGTPEPISYMDSENNNRSATSCDGEDDYFDLNDNLVTNEEGSENGVEDFGGLGSSAKCVLISLNEATDIESIIVYNANIVNFSTGTLNVDIRNGSEAEWTTVQSFDKQTNDFSTVYGIIDGIDSTVTDVRLEVVGNDNSYFGHIGEVELYEAAQ